MDARDLDSIHVSRLTLPFPILAPNVWGDVKAQPALISVDLQLLSGFGSAADGDRLDDSTVHYGVLAKQIRATCREGMGFEELLKEGFKVVEKLANVAKCRILIELPKGSMLGDKVELAERRVYGSSTSPSDRSLGFVDVRVPVLVGVNAYERRKKQPLVIGLTANFKNADLGKLFGLESHLVEVMEKTSFETLETLIDFTVKQLRDRVLDESIPGGKITLRVQKPMAIAFADAPVIEVLRHIPTTASDRVDL